MKAEAWQCEIGESIIDPCYFNPPIPAFGGPSLSVLAFHKDYINGRQFIRAALGEIWIRQT